MPTNNISAIITRDSYAQIFCEEQKIDYLYVDAYDWLNDRLSHFVFDIREVNGIEKKMHSTVLVRYLGNIQ